MNPKRCHLEIQHRKKSVCGLIRTSFRKNGKVAHKTMGFISGLSLDQLLVVRAALQGNAVAIHHPSAPRTGESKEYGASFALLELARQLGMDRLLYSRTSEPWVQDALALIAGRVVYAGSKLSLAHRWKDTMLWELCGTEGSVNVQEHCYAPMDRLLARQNAIERALAKKHLSGEESLVLYDITSSYLEGEYNASRLVMFGYNRDGKKGHAQIVFGLVCNSEGCPVGVEVFPGNTQDAATVKDKIDQIRNRYGVREVVFVGDRGMVISSHFEKMKSVEGLKMISALTHREIQNLLERKVIQLELFDERNIAERVDPEYPSVRYCLCRNPQSAKRETHTRDALLERTAKLLDLIAKRKNRMSPERIGEQVGQALAKTKMGKFVEWKVVDGRLEWAWKQENVQTEQSLDGCYIIRTTVSKSRMKAEKVVETYKSLAQVEQAFRNLKTVQLEVRPFHHKKDERLRAHVFLCMLSYYLLWHFQKRLAPLYAGDGKEKDRFWTLENVLERLKSVRREVVTIGGVPCRIVTDLDSDQTEIFNLLKIKV